MRGGRGAGRVAPVPAVERREVDVVEAPQDVQGEREEAVGLRRGLDGHGGEDGFGLCCCLARKFEDEW